MEKSWFVYFIECRNGSVYTGTTTDVARRFETHVAGKGARYTRMHPPVRLLGFITAENRSEALRAELRVKRLSATAKRAFIAELKNKAMSEFLSKNDLPDIDQFDKKDG